MNTERAGLGDVAQLLTRGRRDAGMTQETLARLAKVSRSRIVAAEAGTSLPTMELCLKLGKALSISAGKLARARITDELKATMPEVLPELEQELWGGTAHWETIADEQGLLLERAQIFGQVEPNGDLRLTRRYEGCTATRPRKWVIFRERIVGERAPQFAMKAVPVGLGYSMHVAIEGEWAVHQVEFRQPWTPNDGTFDVEFENTLPKAFVLDLDEYNQRQRSEGLPTKRDWLGQYCMFVSYAIGCLDVRIVFPDDYRPTWREPISTWGPSPPGDSEIQEMGSRSCQKWSFEAGTNEARLVLTRPVPGYMFALQWTPEAYDAASSERGERR